MKKVYVLTQKLHRIISENHILVQVHKKSVSCQRRFRRMMVEEEHLNLLLFFKDLSVFVFNDFTIDADKPLLSM